MGVHESKTFRSGNSVALRLPKGLGIAADQAMMIEQNGDVLTIRPAIDPAAQKRDLMALLNDMAAIGRPDDGIQARPDFDAPNRHGA